MTSDSDAADKAGAATNKPYEVEKAPGQQEGQPGHEIVFGAQQHGERREVQQDQDATPRRWRLPARGANLTELKNASAGGMLRVPRPDRTQLLPAANRCHHSAINVATQGRRGSRPPIPRKGKSVRATRPRCRPALHQPLFVPAKAGTQHCRPPRFRGGARVR